MGTFHRHDLYTVHAVFLYFFFSIFMEVLYL